MFAVDSDFQDRLLHIRRQEGKCFQKLLYFRVCNIEEDRISSQKIIQRDIENQRDIKDSFQIRGSPSGFVMVVGLAANVKKITHFLLSIVAQHADKTKILRKGTAGQAKTSLL